MRRALALQEAATCLYQHDQPQTQQTVDGKSSLGQQIT
jgi:hypothetical protein